MRSSPPAVAEAGTENNPVYRSGEPLRHPKSSARTSEKLTVRNLSDIHRPGRGGSMPATALDCRPITVLNPDFALRVRDGKVSVVRHR
jgi:hypothetical protein